MATRSRGDSDDTLPKETPESSALRTRTVRATRSASAATRLRRDSGEPGPAPQAGAKAVRASRANARAAANAPAAGVSRTVRIRPDTETSEDHDHDDEPALIEGELIQGGDVADSTPEAPAVVLQPDQPAPPRRKAAPRPTSPPASVVAAVPATVVAPAAVVVPAGPGAAASSDKPARGDRADKPKERKPLDLIAALRFLGDKIGLLAQLAGLIAFLILAIHVLFVASDANANNAIVSWFDRRSNGLVGDFKNIFTAKTAKGRVFYNYGLAAVVYLLAGSLVRRILRK